MINNTSLGIDISSDKINLALLRQGKDGIKLLKSASGPLPDGAIVDGNIKEPVALAGAIKKLVSDNKIRAKKITISLLARPVLAQVIDLPKRIPSNIRQYVHSEVKHCAVLPVKNLAFDYCGMALPGRLGNSRLFVVAAENEKITSIARALSRMGLDLDAVEPAVVAITRALYAKKIAKKFDSNVLIAVVQDTSVSFCVFRRQMFDFIRFKDLGEKLQPSGSAFECFVEQINEIIQFYDIDVTDSPGCWEMVVVLDDSVESADEFGNSLRAVFSGIDVHLSLPQTICDDTSLVGSSKVENTSLAAVGLAMKMLKRPDADLQVNLLSKEAANVKSVKKLALLTANIAAIVMIVMILSVGLLNLKAKRASDHIVSQRQKGPSSETQEMMKEQSIIIQQISDLSEKLQTVNQLLELNQISDWDKILEDIRLSTPKSICITRLISQKGSTITLDGQALSYEGINLFADMLTRSRYIDSTTLAGTGKNDVDGLIMYSINCSLAKGTHLDDSSVQSASPEKEAPSRSRKGT
jgi:Tfp pilus assembly protein PilN